MRPKSQTLTPQELEIMKVIWSLEQATVRAVYESLSKVRPGAYTTVLTMMKVLERKGYIRKTNKERIPVYEPTGSQQNTISGMVTEFIDRVFNGAAQPLMMHLVEDRKLSKKDIAEITRLLQKGKKP